MSEFKYQTVNKRGLLFLFVFQSNVFILYLWIFYFSKAFYDVFVLCKSSRFLSELRRYLVGVYFPFFREMYFYVK